MPPPPPRVAVTVPVKPSAAQAVVFELVIERLLARPECSVIEPDAIVELFGADVPWSASILPSKVPMLSVMLIWLLPAAPDAMKRMVWPLTVMVSPAMKLEEIESEGDAPLSRVAAV